MSTKRLGRSRIVVGSAALAAAALSITGTSLAQAATPHPSNQVVPQGVNGKALPGATPFENTPADTPETVSFILKERNVAQLEKQVEAGVKNYLSVSQFKQQYGQSDATVRELTSYLAKYGITTHVYGNNIDVDATGTAGQFNKALATSQKQYKVPAIKGLHGQHGIPAQTIHAPSKSPTLPADLASDIQVVLGLSNYAPYVSNAQTAAVTDTATAGDTDVWDGDCEALTGLDNACHTPTTFASSYGLSPLYKKSTGAGKTIGIVTLAALDVGAPEYYWSNIADIPATGRTVKVENIDGGPGAPSDAAGTGETDLDVEQSGGVAPGANIVVYQAPNTDAGFVDAFFQAATENTADAVSVSWGESETIVAALASLGEEPKNYEDAYDEAFLELAAQGQSAFDASGDQGAFTASVDAGTTDLSVDSSAASPYITAAGGTTLPFTHTFGASLGLDLPVTITNERAWGWDYLFNVEAQENGVTISDVAPSLISGGGGGFSKYESTPSYQKGIAGTSSYSAVNWLTPSDYEDVTGTGFVEPTAWTVDETPTVVTGHATGRAVPDLSADADPETGYLLWEPSAETAAKPAPALQGGWGGTSYVAPQLAGAAVVIDGANHGRAGLWNPALYKAASSKSSPFTVLSTSGTTNDNLYFTGTPGTIYNPATGLGTPNLAKLAPALAAGSGTPGFGGPGGRF